MANISEIKVGVRVLITGPGKYGLSGVAAFCKEHKVYATVYDHRYLKTEDHMAVEFSHLGMGRQATALGIKDVTVIPESEYKKYDELVAVAKKAANEQQEKILSRLDNTSDKVPLEDRDYTHTTKDVIHTRINFAAIGKWDQKLGTFTPAESGGINYLGECCGFTHTTQDLYIGIPILFANYMGYSRTDIVNYLDFLSHCNIGFKYEFEGESELISAFSSRCSANKVDMNGNVYNVAFGATNHMNIYPGTRKGFYVVKVKGAPYNNITYLRFICVRYLYNMQYWSIPGTAMQIKKALGSKVSHMQALLMAHTRFPYSSGYCLCGQSSSSVVDPFQDVDNVLRVLQDNNHGMTSSWRYKGINSTDLGNAFAKKDWESLLTILKK